MPFILITSFNRLGIDNTHFFMKSGGISSQHFLINSSSWFLVDTVIPRNFLFRNFWSSAKTFSMTFISLLFGGKSITVMPMFLRYFTPLVWIFALSSNIIMFSKPSASFRINCANWSPLNLVLTDWNLFGPL